MSMIGWNKNNILKFSIDHWHVDSSLTDFPVLLNLSTSSGKNNFDCSQIFDELATLAPVSTTWWNVAAFTLSNGNKTIQNTSGVSSWRNARHGQLIVKDTVKFYAEFTPHTIVSNDYFCLGLTYFDEDDPDSNLWDADYIFYMPDGELYIDAVSNPGFPTYGVNDKLGFAIDTFTGRMWISKNNVWIQGDPATNTDPIFTLNLSLKDYRFMFSTARENEKVTLETSQALQQYDPPTGFEDYFLSVAAGKTKKIAITYPSVQEHWAETVDDNFNTDVPNPLLWNTTLPITSNKLERLDNSADTTSVYAYLQYSFTDDFDFQMEAFRQNDNDSETIMIMCGRVYFQFYPTFIRLLLYDAAYATLYSSSVSETLTFTKIRCVRQGSNFSFFYDKNSSWIEVGSYDDTTNAAAGVTATPNIRFHKASSNSYKVAIDNFKVNSGNIEWGGSTPNLELKSYVHGEQEQLFCEVERWDQTNEEAQLWIKIPKVLADQPTDLLLYYDNTQEDNNSYVGDTASLPAQQVWTNNFVAVYHMSQDPSVGGACILDSTSNENHGTPHGSMTSGDVVSGQVGKALDLDGVDDHIIIPYTSVFDYTDGITLEILVDFTRVTDNYSYFIRHQNSSDPWNGWSFSYENRDSMVADSRYRANRIYYNEDNNANKVSVEGSDGTLVAGFTALTSTYNNTSAILYEEGLTVSEEVISDLALNPTENISIGGSIAGLGLLDGVIEEVRISSVSRTSSWVSTTNYSNTDSLISISQADIYQIDGYVKEQGSPVQRTIYLYERVSGELMDKVVSNTLGYYNVRTTASGTHHLVCLDDVASPDYDDLIISKVTATETI